MFPAGEHIGVQRDGVWTRVRLPSGRVLCYLKVECTEDGQLSYMGVNSYTRQWSRIKTYGGKLCFWGGVDVDTLVAGTAEDVAEEVRVAFESAPRAGGLVLTCGNSVITAASSASFL